MVKIYGAVVVGIVVNILVASDEICTNETEVARLVMRLSMVARWRHCCLGRE